MSEKSISERAKETLKWIQKEQKTNGEGMIEFNKVPDQGIHEQVGSKFTCAVPCLLTSRLLRGECHCRLGWPAR